MNSPVEITSTRWLRKAGLAAGTQRCRSHADRAHEIVQIDEHLATADDLGLLAFGRSQEDMLQHGRMGQPMVQDPNRADQTAHGKRQRHERSLQAGQLVVVLRNEERLAREDDRGQYQNPAAQAENHKAGQQKDLGQEAHATRNEERHLQPARRAFEEVAPEEEGEGHDGDKGPDAQAGRVQFDIDPQAAEEDQDGNHFRPAEEACEVIDPAGLDQPGIVFQAVVLLELREVLDDPVCQAIFLGLFAGEREHRPVLRHEIAFFPERPFFALGLLGLAAIEFFLAEIIPRRPIAGI